MTTKRQHNNEEHNFLSRFFQWFITFCIHIFYRHISVRGSDNIPLDMPVVFAGNHANGLIDPLIVYVTNKKRLIRPVAAAYLFQLPVVGYVMRHALHAIPVVRRNDIADHPESIGDTTKELSSTSDNKNENVRQQKNQGSLDAMARVLTQGDCFCIFPEGTSHNSTELLELKTGFARACQIALKERPSMQVAIVPVGLNYEAKNRFRSDIFVEFGQPIILSKEYIDSFSSSEAMIHQLTRELKTRLENVIIHAPSKEVLNGAHLARMMLYKKEDLDQMTQEEYIDKTKEIINVLKKDDPSSRELCKNLSTFQTHLDILGLTYKEMRQGTTSLILSLIVSILSMPLSLPGALYHAPIGLIASYLGQKVAKGFEDQQAHYKVMITLLLLPIVYILTLGLLWMKYGHGTSLLTMVLLVASVYLAIIVRPIQFLRTFPRLITYNKDALQREHNQLREKLVSLLASNQ